MTFQMPTTALDIGSQSIKIIEATGKEIKKIKKIGIELLPEDSISYDENKKTQMLIEVIKSITKRLHITKLKRISIKIDSRDIITSKLNLDISEISIEESVYNISEQYIDGSIEEYYYDFRILNPEMNKEITDVLFVATRKETLNNYIDIIKECGYKIGVAEIDFLSVLNSFYYNYGKTQNITCLVNMGFTSSQIILLDEYCFSREIPVGGNQLTQSLASSLEISEIEAEKIKLSISNKKTLLNEQTDLIFSDFINNFISELGMTINFFLQSEDNTKNYETVSNIFLTGGSCRTLGLAKKILESFECPTTILNPFKNFNMSDKIFSEVAASAHVYGTAVGLSLRKFPLKF